ncbi:hypothetical protein [Paenibacillus xylanexedens]|uniref:hypothetical protein n=1 Tax=Paenibacillus xylanexedens TaxID=528191 RepID=UPI0011A0125A|nr:hypothetical protein [Paenibacillus xylanexedens]
MTTNLYSEIHRVLRTDKPFLDLMGLADAKPAVLGKRIQKRAQPTGLALEGMPLVSFYAIPRGGADLNNYLVYNAIFMFDVYTNDDVSLALDISDRIVELFHGEINRFIGVENFETRLMAQHESTTDLQDSYCFTTTLHFAITLDDE